MHIISLINHNYDSSYTQFSKPSQITRSLRDRIMMCAQISIQMNDSFQIRSKNIQSESTIYKCVSAMVKPPYITHQKKGTSTRALKALLNQ